MSRLGGGRGILRLRPDPEEDLALLIGDVPAHQLARMARITLGWSRRTLSTATRNVGEYLGMMSIAGFGITLFLGGWGAPLSILSFIPSWAWFFAKLFGAIFFLSQALQMSAGLARLTTKRTIRERAWTSAP